MREDEGGVPPEALKTPDRPVQQLQKPKDAPFFATGDIHSIDDIDSFQEYIAQLRDGGHDISSDEQKQLWKKMEERLIDIADELKQSRSSSAQERASLETSISATANDLKMFDRSRGLGPLRKERQQQSAVVDGMAVDAQLIARQENVVNDERSAVAEMENAISVWQKLINGEKNKALVEARGSLERHVGYVEKIKIAAAKFHERQQEIDRQIQEILLDPARKVIEARQKDAEGRLGALRQQIYELERQLQRTYYALHESGRELIGQESVIDGRIFEELTADEIMERMSENDSSV